MGLFDGKEKIEEEIMQKMAQLPIVDDLIKQLLELSKGEEKWLASGVSYYDRCIRKVRIEPDCFEIQRMGDSNSEDIVSRIGYSFTQSGYKPLHAHCNSKGKEDVSLNRVCYLLAAIIRERMVAKWPECHFEVIESMRDYVCFTYKVPAMTFDDWF